MSDHSTKHTFVYRTPSDGVNLSLDVHLPDETKFGLVASLAGQILRQARGKGNDAKDEKHALPVLVFFHGGGLTAGNKSVNSWFPKFLLRDALNAGFCFISVDYTLLSPYDAHAIVDDVKACFDWVAESLNPELVKLNLSQLIDPERIATAGTSAGGYLSYLASFYATPKPKAVISMYSMGCISLLSTEYLTPRTSQFFGDHPFITSDVPFLPLFSSTPSTTPRTTTTSLEHAKEPRVDYCGWLLQKAVFLDVVTGVPGLSASLLQFQTREEREAALDEKTRLLFPQLQFDARFPPTFILHAKDDGIVPVQESRDLKAILEGLGVEVELLEVEEGGHGFANVAKSEEIKGLDRVVPFLLKHV